MKVIDPGHLYEVASLDGDAPQLIRFVKRIGEKFPGNVGPGYPGTTSQELLRILIDRAHYVDNQVPHYSNVLGRSHARSYLWLLEERAALRAGDFTRMQRASIDAIERYPTCPTCGHIFCKEHR